MGDNKIHLEIKNKDVAAHKVITIDAGGELEAGDKIKLEISGESKEYEVPGNMKMIFSIHGHGTITTVE